MGQIRHPRPQPLRGGESLRNGLKDKGRRRRNDLAAIKAGGAGKVRNDLLPKLELVHFAPDALKPPTRNVRTVDPVHVRRVMNSIAAVGFIVPVLIDQHNEILDGVIATEAAKQLGLASDPLRARGASHRRREASCAARAEPPGRKGPVGVA